jgi:hypothetical protein
MPEAQAVSDVALQAISRGFGDADMSAVAGFLREQ